MKRRACSVFLCLLLALIAAMALPACSPAITGSEDASAQQGASSDANDAGAKNSAGSASSNADDSSTSSQNDKAAIDEDGTYTSKDEVALYLHTYGHLPSNFITKDEAEDAGWKTEGLNLDEACPGKSIGGDRFSNREGKLPKAKGRTWYECDIDYNGGRSRGAKRIVYSSDGLVYYTEDHYKTFEQLY